jgi:hypothetical protein
LKLSDESKTPLKEEILDKLAVLITAAFGLVSALAWNQAITAIFKALLFSKKYLETQKLWVQ